MKTLLAIYTITSLLVLNVSAQPTEGPVLKVYPEQAQAALSDHLYGIFFEDINFGADGGLYAELVQNRSFEYFPVRGEMNDGGYDLHALTAWEVVHRDGGEGRAVVTRAIPLNDVNRNNLEIFSWSDEGTVGVYNTGYDGIPLKAGENYLFSAYMRREVRGWERSSPHSLTVRLEDPDGNVLAETDFGDLSADWEKYTATFVPNATVPEGRLVILAGGRGKVQLDMVSLFPEDTYNGRKNGLRRDLVETLEAMQPTFLRFPGGCILHGWGIDNVYNWKHTTGDVAERKPNWNRWGYHQTYGLGYYEYFLLSEDLGAEPLPVVPLGVACSFTEFECVPMEHMDHVIQDALDLVEFANGPVTSKWGAVRAEMGHPEPFGMKYICLGNEEGDTPEVRERIPLFVEAIREKYPDLMIIGTSGLSPDVPLYDLMAELDVYSSDEHYYFPPEWYIDNQNRFDDWDRSKPLVFVGEYASLGNKMFNAVAEAIYLTGIERNGDIVDMTCYAPLLARYGNTQWKRANLIWFDNEQVVKTPNYYVQQLFSTNKGDVYVKNEQQNWPGKELGVSPTYDAAAGELIIKIANAGEATTLEIDLEGKKAHGKGTVTLLQGDKDAENTREHPENIAPVTTSIKGGKRIRVEVPAMSVQAIRLPVK